MAATSPVIKIEVFGEDVEALASTLVALAAKVSPTQTAPAVSEEMSLSELVDIVRARAVAEGYKLLVVKADEGREEDPAPAAAEDYEPKAVKRRRRTKAEMEAARAAEAAAAEEPEQEEEEDAPDEAAELSVEELEAVKKDAIRKLLVIHKEPGGPARIDSLLAEYRKMGFAAAATIPARYFPEIARRLA